jgi:broad specificity phosphatase PhoE
MLRVFLRHAGVRQIASSPLERCLQTAHLVADPQANGHLEAAIPLETWQALMELQPGEPIDSIRARFWPTFQTAWAMVDHLGPLALVTHGGPISFLLEEMGLDAGRLKQTYEFDHHNPVPPAGAWRITRSGPDQPWAMALVFLPSDPAWQPKSIEIGSVTP